MASLDSRRDLAALATGWKRTLLRVAGQPGHGCGSQWPRAAFQAAKPVPLFQARIAWTAGFSSTNDRVFTVNRAGDRFLINQLTSDVRASAINVVIDRRGGK